MALSIVNEINFVCTVGLRRHLKLSVDLRQGSGVVSLIGCRCFSGCCLRSNQSVRFHIPRIGARSTVVCSLHSGSHSVDSVTWTQAHLCVDDSHCHKLVDTTEAVTINFY